MNNKKLPDGTLFPDNTNDIEWRLRYAPDTINREDQLNLASICSAYRYITKEATQERVKYVCRHIKESDK